MPLSQQNPSVFIPKHQRCVVAFPHAAIATAPATGRGLGWWVPEVMASGLQAFLKLRNAPAHGRTLGRVGVDDGVFVVGTHAVLSDKVNPLFVGLKSLSYGLSFIL